MVCAALFQLVNAALVRLFWAAPLHHCTFRPTFGVFGFPSKSMLKLQDLRAHAEMEFMWSSIYCESSRSEVLQTLADNELLTCKNTVPRFTRSTSTTNNTPKQTTLIV